MIWEGACDCCGRSHLPSETVQMDKDKILAFVTVHGSANSHTAILARMMNIPALIGVDMDLEALTDRRGRRGRWIYRRILYRAYRRSENFDSDKN